MKRPVALRRSVLLAVAALAITVPATAAHAADGFTSTMVNQANGNCADVPGGASTSALQLVLWSCNSGTNQQFHLTPVSGAGNTFTVVSVSSGKCVAPSGDSSANNTALVQLPCSGVASRAWQLPGFGSSSTPSGYQGIPNLNPNSCKNSGLPRAYGTNFHAPSDPYGQGFQNTTTLGWDGNYWPVFTYLSGSFFARGVNNATYNGLCGGMYSSRSACPDPRPAARSTSSCRCSSASA